MALARPRSSPRRKAASARQVVDIFGIADRDRPEVSVLSDEFLDSITEKSERPNLQIRLLEKLLRDEVRGRIRSNRLQAKLFSEQLEAALHRYELRQLTSAEVIERLVELAKEMRAARRRHEQLGLSEEEVAFYDALAGGVEDVKADPKLATVAHDLVEGIRTDLTVDWADREATEAKVRAKIKRLLRKHRYRPPRRAADGGSGGGGPLDLDEAAQLVLEQAKALYRRWPEVEVGERLVV